MTRISKLYQNSSFFHFTTEITVPCSTVRENPDRAKAKKEGLF